MCRREGGRVAAAAPSASASVLTAGCTCGDSLDVVASKDPAWIAPTESWEIGIELM